MRYKDFLWFALDYVITQIEEKELEPTEGIVDHEGWYRHYYLKNEDK